VGIARRLHLDRVQMIALGNLGIATKDLGNYRQSLTYYDESLALVRAAGDRNVEANTLNNIGNLHRILGEHDKALAAHERALVLARDVENAEHEARALNTIGSTHYQLGNFAKALDYHDQSLAIRRRIDDLAGQAASLDGAGLARHRLGDSVGAIEYLNEALRIRRAIAERHRESDTLVHLALVERDRGHVTAALEHVEAAVTLTNSLRQQVISPELRASFVAAEQERYELYIDVLMQLHQSRPDDGFAARALEASEHGRARVLMESLLEARTDIRRGIDAALLERERTYQRRLDEASTRLSRLSSRQSAPKDVEAARAALETLSDEYRQLQVRIRQQSPAYAALTQPPPLTTTEMQRDLVDAGTVLLEYALGEKRSWLWAMTPTGIASFELPPRREIERVARPVYELLTARQLKRRESADDRTARVANADKEWRRHSIALGRMLTGPAAAHLGEAWRGKRLLIVAADILQYVPFSALPDPGREGLPLVVDHEIVNLPSLSVLAAIRQQGDGRVPPSKKLAVLADPVFEADDPRVAAAPRARQDGARPATRDAEGPGATPVTRALANLDEGGSAAVSRLSRLPFSRQEAREIAALVPVGQRLEATDFQASRATATSAELGDYSLVHFATHGFFNSEHPELSGLVFSLVDRQGRPQDGFLRLQDIYNLRLAAEVVVLSACQTALGKEIRGEGLVGPTRGFMYAGARRVVASLWQVDDLATADLMRAFYRGMLKDGLRPAAALRAAQRELARQPRWASPFYWSAFVLQGEWR
jgi:CHAT domain-containing protein